MNQIGINRIEIESKNEGNIKFSRTKITDFDALVKEAISETKKAGGGSYEVIVWSDGGQIIGIAKGEAH